MFLAVYGDSNLETDEKKKNSTLMRLYHVKERITIWSEQRGQELGFLIKQTMGACLCCFYSQFNIKYILKLQNNMIKWHAHISIAAHVVQLLINTGILAFTVFMIYIMYFYVFLEL